MEEGIFAINIPVTLLESYGTFLYFQCAGLLLGHMKEVTLIEEKGYYVNV